MSNHRGTTMIELCIYMFLFAIATGVAIALFNVTRTAGTHTTASYLVNGNTDTAIRWLRQDLKETALSSIQVYPAAGEPQPGVSMVSARTVERGKLLVSRHGAPQWEKHVFYTLESSGNLVRWERELTVKNLLPSLAELRPSQIEGTVRRVVLGGVVVPDFKLEDAGSSANVTAGPRGGFRVQFVRRVGGDDGVETLVDENPRLGNPQDNTRLVEAELQIYRKNGARPDYYAIRFRVAPNY